MTDPNYPALSDLMGSMFHQDFDVAGDTLAEIVQAFREVSSRAEQVALENEIERFLLEHADNVDDAFEKMFRPEVIPAAFSGSTRAFLEEISELLAS
jgi:contact-dependent growth inhibition (CDI) system CdiI-like immunity protein